MTVYLKRVGRVQTALRENGYDYLFLSISPDLFYLTGYSSFLSERLHMLVVGTNGRPVLVFPDFETSMVAHLADWIDIVGWQETQDPVGLVRDSLAANDRDRRIKVAISDQTYSVFLLRLQAALPNAEFSPASKIIAPMRMLKDQVELSILQEAQDMGVKALERLFEEPFTGRTEKQVATGLRRHCEEVGFDQLLGSIVGSGPNGASPHLHPTDRVIQKGEPVVIDFGGVHRGYFSDCTRTVFTGAPTVKFQEIFEIVRRANHAALASVRPNVTCESVDRAARQVIKEAGYGPYFTHRLGHGIGIQVHEEPYMVGGNELLLKPGMTFTDEPGIYLPGEFGCRLEDVVRVTDKGGEAITYYTHEIIIVD